MAVSGFGAPCLSGGARPASVSVNAPFIGTPLARGTEILDSRRITGRSIARRLPQRVSRRLSIDVRWLGIGAALVLTLLAGVMVELVLSDHSRLRSSGWAPWPRCSPAASAAWR